MYEKTLLKGLKLVSIDLDKFNNEGKGEAKMDIDEPIK